MSRRRKVLGIGLILISLISLGVIGCFGISSRLRMHKLLNNNISSEISIDTADLDEDYITHDQKLESITSNTNIIQIPYLSLEAPIAEGVDSDTLSYAVGHFPDTGKIGDIGNYCLAGHSSSIYNCVFNGLADIPIGEQIILYNAEVKSYKYIITSKEEISPYNAGVLNDSNDRRLTIITCIKGGTMRLCLTAKIMSETEEVAFQKSYQQERLKVINNTYNEYIIALDKSISELSSVEYNKLLKHNIEVKSPRNKVDGYKYNSILGIDK